MWCAHCQCTVPACPEMSGSENVLHCPHVVVHLIELSHNLSSSGYTYDSVPLGQAMMEHDKTSHPPHSHPPTTMATLKEQVALLMQQIQALQNQLSAQSLSPPVDPPPLPTTTKLLKIATPTPFTGLQDDLDHSKAARTLYISL